ncbi:MAG: C25 family cysteine peptidase, partial [Chitinophagaceae bacterium]
MKKVFTILCLILGLVTKAQYNNEWIDYNKTYFKFKVGSTGLYQIPQAVLQSAGIGSVPAENYQLWRNGEQVPLYTSVSTGAFGAADFIEFYGIMNDGKKDTKLYRTPALQLSDKWSLHTDTAAYFLTVNPGGGNLRLVNENNDVAGNLLPPEAYFMHTLEINYKTKLNPGVAAVVGGYVYSSSYDLGEGWTSREIATTTPLVENFSNLYLSGSGPAVSFRIAASGNALNARRMRVFVNGTQVLDQQMNFFGGGTYNTSFANSLIGQATDTIRFNNISSTASDRMVVHKFEMTYPRSFNFGGTNQFQFSLPASAAGNYLEITNFNTGGSSPILLDNTNGKRYTGDISVPGMIRFALPAAGQRSLVLLSNNAVSVKIINALAQRNFINYAITQNQGDYLIISNPRLYNGPNGNPVDAYRAYRTSVAGGSYNAKIYNIDQLEDQFAFGIKSHPFSIKNFLRFARSNFSQSPKFVFLIGRGLTYDQFRLFESRSSTENIALIPTFGLPGSDNVLGSDDYDAISETPIGRLAAVLPIEVEHYLDKVKEHDLAIKTGSQTLKDRSWMKNIVHAIGGSDPYLQAVIFGYMNAAGDILKDTLFGANVKSFSKNAAFSVQQLTSAELQNLFTEGINILTYFGHSSANTLEFNLEDPNVYNNQGKYPLFIVNGCNAGNFFLYDTTRFSSNNQTLSEKYVLADKRGSIGFIASTHYGIVNYLNIFTNSLYASIANEGYNLTVGRIHELALQKVLDITGATDFYGRMHTEQITLHGDPAINLYPHVQPDFVVEDPQIKITPGFVSVADATFEINAKIFNIGKAVNDSIVILVQRQLPAGNIVELYRQKIPAIRFVDSL